MQLLNQPKALNNSLLWCVCSFGHGTWVAFFSPFLQQIRGDVKKMLDLWCAPPSRGTPTAVLMGLIFLAKNPLLREKMDNFQY